VRKGPTITGIALALVAAAFVVTPPGQAKTPPAAAETAAPEKVRVKVLTQNIMYGGDDYDLETGEYCAKVDRCMKAFHRLRNIIVKSDADIVGLQEPERNVTKMARLLGWHASPAAHVISRFPIIEPPRADGLYVFVAVTPDQVVAVSNVHLSSDPWGPDMVAEGKPLRQVLAAEQAFRVRDIRPNLRGLPPLVRKGIPVILTGDFNSPSHLDWTEEMTQARPNVVKYPVRWPASARLAKAGFVDSYREAHPDPVADMGFTWTPGGPSGSIADYISDRIDWILHSGKVSTVDSIVVGEQGAPHRASVELAVKAPYPSDHRGVLSTLDVTPHTPPVYASTQPKPITAGERILVSYHAPKSVHAVLTDARGHRVVSIRTPGTFGRTSVKVGARLDGKYLITLKRQGTGRVVSSQPIFVYQPGEKSTVRTVRDSYRFKQPIKVRFTKAPGMRLDWVGIFPCKRNGKCGDAYSYVRYGYTGSRVQGTVRIGKVFPPMVYREGWPIKPGQYVIRLMADDSYKRYAQSPRFTVTRR
jgi:endonuclease/exonuclease/phosphatase family metal-dependent hydrolase